jgi:hypothetical protein
VTLSSVRLLSASLTSFSLIRSADIP